MRVHSLFFLLCLLAALSTTSNICYADDTEIKGTPVKISEQSLHFSGHIQRLNAQLPVPWFGLDLSESFTPQAWTFEGSYWDGVAEICKKYQCSISYFAGQAEFETKGDVAFLVPQGAVLFSVAKKLSDPYLFMMVEPHIGILDANITKITIDGKDINAKKDMFELAGGVGDIGNQWELEVTRETTGVMAVELEAEFIVSTTTLVVEPVKGSTATEGALSATVSDVTNNEINIKMEGGEILSVRPNDAALEGLVSTGMSTSGSFSREYKIDNWTPGTKFFVTFAKETKTKKFSVEFKDIDFKKLVPEEK